MRIYRRHHAAPAFAWELDVEKPITPPTDHQLAKASTRRLPSGEWVGLVQHRGNLTYLRALHEVLHVVRRAGDELHHPWWHFCACVPGKWRKTAAHSTPLERHAAQLLWAARDGTFVDVDA